MANISGNLADGQPMKVGGWYNGQQWDGSKLSAPGVTSGGQVVSDAVIAQTNPNNVSFINNQRLNAGQITSQTSAGTSVQSEVSSAQKALQDSLTAQQTNINQQLQSAQIKQDQTLSSIQQQSTPFQADYQKQQQDKLYINQNFQANQDLTNQLGDLLSQGNALIKQQQNTTGLAAVRNPRIAQTISDIAAQAGVIQAVLSARNNQIGQAQTIIDNNVKAIQNDRTAQISYYTTVLNLNDQKLIRLDAQSQDLAKQQTAILQENVTNAQATADYVKQLLVNPASAQLMGQAGVSLNDSVDQINAKLTQAQYTKEISDMSNTFAQQGAQPVANPSGIPSAQLVTMTDSRGGKHYYQLPAKASSTQSVVDSFFQGLGGASSGSSSSAGSVAPTFKPGGGNGTVWVDPQSGVIWQYNGGKWGLL